MATKVTTGERRGMIAVLVILAAAALILALRGGGGGPATADVSNAPTATAIDSAAATWVPDTITQKAPADTTKSKKRAKPKPAPKPNIPKPSPLSNPINRISLNNTLITNDSR